MKHCTTVQSNGFNEVLKRLQAGFPQLFTRNIVKLSLQFPKFHKVTRDMPGLTHFKQKGQFSLSFKRRGSRSEAVVMRYGCYVIGFRFNSHLAYFTSLMCYLYELVLG